jgi:glucose-1-phosphate thymidylyltransferase
MIGLVPAAGLAQRWRGQLGFSKELYPITLPAQPDKSIPVIVALLEAFRLAGVPRAIIVTRSIKFDIPATLRDGKDFGCPLAYVVVDASPSVPHSVVAAASFLEGCDVVLGFPDVVFEPHDAMRTIVDAWLVCRCDVLLGLFETDHPETADMVEMDERRLVRRIIVKQPSTLRYAWLVAVWRPQVTAFLRECVRDSDRVVAAGELHLGNLLQKAIDGGFTVAGLPVDGGRFLDLGSPENVERLGAFWARG